ncbi:hypothetical protein NDU88_006558 [Pleurodeles waltl]|uniref:Uncharacterized protein n=1 Tax=Pleurodeles waltl TaxID=8319 RepID=A0AAV7PMS2_PLEWA|nr:hypothetical protein NDU88_006558 [Pleurodeles waltl]
MTPVIQYNLRFAVGRGRTPSPALRGRPSALWIPPEPGARGPRPVPDTGTSAIPPGSPRSSGGQPRSRPSAPHVPAGATQAHPWPTQLGRGRAGAPRAQLTFLGAAPSAAARTRSRDDSVLYAVPTGEARGLRQGPRRRLCLS